MDKKQDKTATTITYKAFIANKPMAPFTEKEVIDHISIRTLDPSSYLRTDRYPVPSSFAYRSNPLERDYA